MLHFILMTIFGLAATEVFSYLAHRCLFHGVLWRVHQTHHQTRTGKYELNDVFSLFFAGVSMSLMIFAERPFVDSISFPIGFGIAVYGVLYFVTHDLFTHRRFLPFKSKNKIIQAIRTSHQQHHQSTERRGREPFGLFLFDYKKFAGKNKER